MKSYLTPFAGLLVHSVSLNYGVVLNVYYEYDGEVLEVHVA